MTTTRKKMVKIAKISQTVEIAGAGMSGKDSKSDEYLGNLV